MKEYRFKGIMSMWNINQTKDFQEWFDRADKKLQVNIVEHVELLRQMGPLLGRPHADTIKGSSIRNLKELRFSSGEKVIRLFFFFVFDPERNGVLLIGGNKSSSGSKTFYKDMISKSEKIYSNYLKDKKNREKK